MTKEPCAWWERSTGRAPADVRIVRAWRDTRRLKTGGGTLCICSMSPLCYASKPAFDCNAFRNRLQRSFIVRSRCVCFIGIDVRPVERRSSYIGHRIHHLAPAQRRGRAVTVTALTSTTSTGSWASSADSGQAVFACDSVNPKADSRHVSRSRNE
jgi:hypothetical protein